MAQLKPIPQDPLYKADRAVARALLSHDGTVSDVLANGIGVTKTQLHVGVVTSASALATTKLLRSNANGWVKALGVVGIAAGAIGTMVYLESPRLPANEDESPATKSRVANAKRGSAARGSRFGIR